MSFLLSALPWVIYGLCVAVICANLGSRKKQEEGLGKRISLGISLGLLLGVTLNGLGLWENHGTGLALGPPRRAQVPAPVSSSPQNQHRGRSL